MTIVRRDSLADQASAALLARIQSGEWGVGDKLPGETTLGPQLDVGRSTVREAIRILAARGVLTTRQGAGVFVAALDVSESWNVVVQRAGIASVLEARTAVEAEAAGLAAGRRTAKHLRELRRALDERDRRRTEIAEHVDSDMAFHRAIVGAAQSPILLELFDGFAGRSRQAMIDMLRLRGQHGDDADHDIHESIYEAIVSRDVEASISLTRAHLRALQASTRA